MVGRLVNSSSTVRDFLFSDTVSGYHFSPDEIRFISVGIVFRPILVRTRRTSLGEKGPNGRIPLAHSGVK